MYVYAREGYVLKMLQASHI